jgi:hypothetical protein
MAKTQAEEVDPQDLMNRSRQKMRQNQHANSARNEMEEKEPDVKKKIRKRKIGKAVFDKQFASRKRGRPIKLTREIAESIQEGLRHGLFVRSILQSKGVARSTYYWWIDQAEKDRSERKTSIYTEFLDMIKKAEAEVEDKNVQAIQAGASGWKSHAWFLERRFPTRWGKRMCLSVDEAKDFMRKFLTVVAQHVSDKEVLRKVVEEARGLMVNRMRLPDDPLAIKP